MLSFLQCACIQCLVASFVPAWTDQCLPQVALQQRHSESEAMEQDAQHALEDKAQLQEQLDVAELEHQALQASAEEQQQVWAATEVSQAGLSRGCGRCRLDAFVELLTSVTKRPLPTTASRAVRRNPPLQAQLRRDLADAQEQAAAAQAELAQLGASAAARRHRQAELRRRERAARTIQRCYRGHRVRGLLARGEQDRQVRPMLVCIGLGELQEG